MVPGVRPSPMRWVGSDTAERSWGSQSRCGRWRGQGSVQECHCGNPTGSGALGTYLKVGSTFHT